MSHEADTQWSPALGILAGTLLGAADWLAIIRIASEVL